jgi:hypothetical protein
MPRDLDGLALRLMLEFTELSLKLQGGGLDHDERLSTKYV